MQFGAGAPLKYVEARPRALIVVLRLVPHPADEKHEASPVVAANLRRTVYSYRGILLLSRRETAENLRARARARGHDFSVTDRHVTGIAREFLRNNVMLAARHRARLTMEEGNADQQERVRYRNVRRRLFQDDDEDNNRQTTNSENNTERTSNGENDNFANRLFEEARQNLENAKERWNFDFENEVPLPGRYEWVKLDRDGNEISESAQLKNGVCDSHEERPEETAEVDTKE